MSRRARMLAFAWVVSTTLMIHPVGAAPAGAPAVEQLMAKELAGAPDKEVVMLTVEYGPGGSDPIHRHDAQAFVYVLEGTVEMQVKGGQLVTLTPGQTFYEGPDDVHIVGRNASKTKPAKFVVVLIKKQGAPALIPE